VSRILIQFDRSEDQDPDSESGTRSRKAKVTHKWRALLKLCKKQENFKKKKFPLNFDFFVFNLNLHPNTVNIP